MPDLHRPPVRLTHRALGRVRRIWRGTVRERWGVLRAPVLLGIAITSLVLGTIGYMQLKSVSPRYGLIDAVYRAITLFGFGGAASPPVPVTLQIARIMAPLLTGYAAIGTLLALSREQARVAAIRLFVRHHVIIAGLGATGQRLASTLVDHVPVVVIESDPAAARLVSARLRGVRTLIGDATDPKVLRQAGIRHAQTLLVVCGVSDVNVDVAAATTRCLHGRSSPLTIFLHLDNLDLWGSLAAEGATFQSEQLDVRLEYFNVLATAAQLLVEREPPLRADGAADRPHLLVVGLEGIGIQLVLQLARLWTAERSEPADRLWVTLGGERADQDRAELLARYPAIEHVIELDTRPLAVESAAFQAGAAMAEGDGRCDVTRAYVTLTDEARGLLAALALHSRADAAHVPVTVVVADAPAGVGVLLGSERGRFNQVEPFGYLSAATGSNLLLRGTNELLARAQHAQWLRRERAAGTSPQDNAAMRPWEELDEAGRERNRRFADDLHAKLDLVHCMLVPMPLPDPTRPPFEFAGEELETLARHEHVRWMAAMEAAGWRYGVPRDNARRIHDQIKPWEELDEPNRDKDRDAVRQIPAMLATAGFTIRRRDASGATTPSSP